MQVRDLDDLLRESATISPGVSAAEVYPGVPGGDAILAVDVWEIGSGQSTSEVDHADDRVYCVLSGAGEVRAAGGAASVKLAPGTSVQLRPRERHTIHCHGPGPLRLLVVSPLLTRTERALRGPEPGQVARVTQNRQKVEVPPAQEHVAAAAPAAQPVPTVASAAQDEALPDISKLVRRASEIAPVPRAARPQVREPELETSGEYDAEGNGEEAEDVEEEAQNLMELLVVFDGGSKGNPGQGYGSFLVQSPGRKAVIKRLEFGDNYTNNQAEYDSLIGALKYIIERLEVTGRSPSQVDLDIRTDSDLVANQLLGTFKVKDMGLRKRYTEAIELLDRFANWQATWHPREESVKLLGH
jgi:ribonuclease HI/quercetin dioxygenase-like cupin family protein